MALLIVIGVCVLWCMVFNVARDMYTEAKHHRDDRIMAAYQRQEAARMHAWNLADIDRTVQATAEEMVRVAAEADDGVIEGTAVEVKR
jgi:hypothetical protein